MSIYISSDWHGAYWAWQLVRERLGYNDMLYFLGDATDRGSGLNNDGGWTMLKEMLDDLRVIYLKGNHDAMLVDAFLRPNSYNAINLNWMNGGTDTLAAANADPDAYKYIHKIQQLPTYDIYTRPDGAKVFLSHSGSTHIDDERDLIWDRSEYFTTQNWTGYDYVIHGHTRPQHIIKDLNNANKFYGLEKKYAVPAYTGGAYWYLPWRCTVDCGTVLSNQITLLNIDTFEEEIFNAPSSQNELY